MTSGLEALVVDAHLDAEFLLEPLGVRHESVFVALDEALPAQHAQPRAFFRAVGKRRRFRLPMREQGHACRQAG
jgi:hypothetical protein